MAEFLEGLLVSAVSGAVIAALLFLAKPFVKNRASHRSQYFSWYPALLRMLLPVSFGGFFLGDLISLMQSGSVQASADPASQGDLSAVISSASPLGAVGRQQVPGSAPSALGGGPFVGGWSPLLFALWLLGLTAVLGMNLAGYLRYARRIKTSRRPVDNAEITVLLKSCGAALKLPRLLPVYVSPCTDTPMLAGIVRCAIVLPDRSFTPDQLRHALTHELVHYRRHDNLLKWIAVLAVGVNWFNPMAYLAARESGRQCELSCDETVTAGYSREERIRYGRTLLTTASKAGQKPFTLSATMSEDKRNLQERLETLTKAKKKSSWTAILSISLLCTVAAATALTFLVSCGRNSGSSAPEGTGRTSANVSANVSAADDSGPDGKSGPDSSSPPANTPSAAGLESFLSYVHGRGFKTLANSSIAGTVRLPESFSEMKDGFEIGKFLEARNALSRQNGLDFSGCLGKTITVYSCAGEKRQPGEKKLTEIAGGADTVTLTGLYDGDKIAAFWSAPPQNGSSKKGDDFTTLSDYLGTD